MKTTYEPLINGDLWQIATVNGQRMIDMGGLGLAKVAMNSGNKAGEEMHLQLLAAAPELTSFKNSESFGESQVSEIWGKDPGGTKGEL